MRNLLSMMLVVFLPLTLASDTQHRFKVYVSVDGKNDTVTSILTSHLKKELRALGDVDIVGSDDDWKYAIRAFYIQMTKSGVKTGGLSIATITETRVPKFYLKENVRNMKVVLPGVLGVAYWPEDRLQEWCISEIGSFNDNVLEIARSVRKPRK